MELGNVRKLLAVIALAQSNPADGEELQALRNISLAMIHIADAIAQILNRLDSDDHRRPPIKKSSSAQQEEVASPMPVS